MSIEIELVQGRIWFKQIQNEVDDLSRTNNIVYHSLDHYFSRKYDERSQIQSDLGTVIKFSREMISVLLKYSDQIIVFYTAVYNDTKLINSLFLLGSFSVIVLRKDVIHFMSIVKQSLTVAASSSQEKLRLTKSHKNINNNTILKIQKIGESLRGIEKGCLMNWISFDNFDIQSYANQLIQFKLSEIVPMKLFAFSSPMDESFLAKKLEREQLESLNSKMLQSYLKPSEYIAAFKQLGITQIIRLNSKTYKSFNFTNYGIKHHDIYFPKNSLPTRDQIKEFIHICSQSERAAVHCTTGNGRACLMIAIYCMNKLNFNACEVINWIRLLRPESLTAQQQQFLEEQEEWIQKL